MIVYFEDGRLGNQIFQLIYLCSMKKNNEKILIFGMPDFFNLFETKDIIHIPDQHRYFFRYLRPFFRLLTKGKILTTVYESKKRVLGFLVDSNEVKIEKGLLSFLKYVDYGFFQSDKYLTTECVHEYKIKSEFIKDAQGFLKNIPANKKTIFIHIRMGDYLDWTVLGESPVLPLDYYINTIDMFDQDETFFVFLSDDYEYINQHFSHVKNKMLSDNSMYVDFAIMSLCDGGILSASSFSYWGAFFARGNDKKKVFYAPKFWLGHKSKIWFPLGIESKSFDYIDIIDDNSIVKGCKI